jgi:hypothetical protein
MLAFRIVVSYVTLNETWMPTDPMVAISCADSLYPGIPIIEDSSNFFTLRETVSHRRIAGFKRPVLRIARCLIGFKNQGQPYPPHLFGEFACPA